MDRPEPYAIAKLYITAPNPIIKTMHMMSTQSLSLDLPTSSNVSFIFVLTPARRSLAASILVWRFSKAWVWWATSSPCIWAISARSWIPSPISSSCLSKSASRSSIKESCCCCPSVSATPPPVPVQLGPPFLAAGGNKEQTRMIRFCRRTRAGCQRILM